jgi:hypothetical protein
LKPSVQLLLQKNVRVLIGGVNVMI